MRKLGLIHLNRFVFLQLLFVSLVHAEIPADLLKSAESGKASAQYSVARSYELGKRVKSDNAKAISWYTKAADQGHTDAAYRLGLLYYKGLGGFKIDLKKAFHYISLAAKKNHKNSQINLAKMYAKGEGVKRNKELSDYWYEQAYPTDTKEQKKSEPVVSVEPKPVQVKKAKQKKPPTVFVVSSKKKKIKFPSTILAKKWLQKGKASVYLKSSRTQCKTKKNKLVCTSSKLKGSHPTGAYLYKMRSIITRGDNAKDINIQYRKRYITVPEETVEAYDDDDTDTENVQGKLVIGWEKKSHSIDCRFESAKAILCRPIGEDAFYIKSR